MLCNDPLNLSRQLHVSKRASGYWVSHKLPSPTPICQLIFAPFPGNNTHLSKSSIPMSSVSAALQMPLSTHCTCFDKMFASLCGLIPNSLYPNAHVHVHRARRVLLKTQRVETLVDRRFVWDVWLGPPCHSHNASLQCNKSVHSWLKFSSDTKCQACGYFPNELIEARRSSAGLCNIEISTESSPLKHTSAAEGFPAISPF